jgi:hypothetical protein
VNKLEIELAWAKEDRENCLRDLKSIRHDRDRVLEKFTQNDECHSAQKIDLLVQLMRDYESRDKDENRSIRDQSKVLEGEHNALQKRFREQESKLSNVERAAATARQNLSQAQHRAAEGEKRVRELEDTVDRCRVQINQLEGIKEKRDEEIGTLKVEFESRCAEHRVSQLIFLLIERRFEHCLHSFRRRA